MSDSEKKNFDAFDINMHLIIGSLIRKNHAPKRKIGDNDDQIQRLTFFDPQQPFQCERDYDASEIVRIANVAKKSFRQLQWYGLVCACDFFLSWPQFQLGTRISWKHHKFSRNLWVYVKDDGHTQTHTQMCASNLWRKKHTNWNDPLEKRN